MTGLNWLKPGFAGSLLSKQPSHSFFLQFFLLRSDADSLNFHSTCQFKLLKKLMFDFWRREKANGGRKREAGGKFELGIVQIWLSSEWKSKENNRSLRWPARSQKLIKRLNECNEWNLGLRQIRLIVGLVAWFIAPPKPRSHSNQQLILPQCRLR